MTVATKHQATSREGTRASVTFPGDIYAELERIAEQKKVSVAWVVRDAVQKYVEAQYPLFGAQHPRG
jgi:metal-responsive CopG/Arc/MetJ family transcriptional regulator